MKSRNNIRICRSVILNMWLILIPFCAQAQTKFKIATHQYRVESKKIKNEWNTKDEIKELYLVNKGDKEKVLSYYAYKDEGGDCNNLFWDKATLNIKGNSLIVTVHHFQKTGIDPITEWEQITYRVNVNGKPELVAHLYKKFGSNEWKTEEEWYKQ